MITSKKRAIGCLAVALMLVGVTTFARAEDQNSASSTISKGDAATTSDISAGAPQAPSPEAPPAVSPGDKSTATKTLTDSTLREKVKEVLTKLTPERMRLNREYQQAAGLFPAFCKDWERMLHDREANNIQHIVWRLENGFETALYTGYSGVKTCEAHQSPEGFSIGKLSYEEFHYLIKAKTLDEAKHTTATPVDDTHTTEIFRWEKGKWFY